MEMFRERKFPAASGERPHECQQDRQRERATSLGVMLSGFGRRAAKRTCERVQGRPRTHELPRLLLILFPLSSEVAMDGDQRLESAYQALRFGLGGTAFLAGLDKFFDLLTDWDQYLSPVARKNLPMSTKDFMHLVGIVEMAVGATILADRTRFGGYLAGAWLLGIAANLISTGQYFDIAARDVNMAIGAYALAVLGAARRRASRAGVWEEISEAA